MFTFWKSVVKINFSSEKSAGFLFAFPRVDKGKLYVISIN